MKHPDHALKKRIKRIVFNTALCISNQLIFTVINAMSKLRNSAGILEVNYKFSRFFCLRYIKISSINIMTAGLTNSIYRLKILCLKWIT